MKGHRLTCTFCRRPEHQVRKLVAGPGVYICDRCIEVAHRIVSTDEPPATRRAPWQRVAARLLGLVRSLRGQFRLRFAPWGVV